MKGQFIYKIINTVNGKFYVGSTTNTKERFRTHRNRLRKGRHHAKHLQAAWDKYGEQSFIFHVVEVVPESASLQAAEDVWLAAHVGKDYCYNKSKYSDSPMRGIAKEDHPCFGRPKTDAEREAISASLKAFYAEDITNHPRFGKQHSEETKARIRQKKLQNPTKAWLGKERSEETRAKISEAQKGKPKAPRKYTEEGLAKVRATMQKNAKPQKPADFESVKVKFHPDVLAKYDFSDAVYLGALVRIEGCVCPEHGVFSQYAVQFRKGRGCPSCGAQQRTSSMRKTIKEMWATEDGRKTFMENRKRVDPA